VINVSNLDQSIEFYRDVLGLNSHIAAPPRRKGDLFLKNRHRLPANLNYPAISAIM